MEKDLQPLSIGLGNHTDRKGDSIGRQVGGLDIGSVVGHQTVLGFQDLLHPAGNGADLTIDRVGNIAHGIGQVGVLAVQLLQPGEEGAPGQKDKQQGQTGGAVTQAPMAGERLSRTFCSTNSDTRSCCSAVNWLDC